MRNTGGTPVDGRQLAFAFPGDQRITQMWNAVPAQDGRNVVAGNPSGYNVTIAPGASVNLGFNGASTTGTNGVPTACKAAARESTRRRGGLAAVSQNFRAVPPALESEGPRAACFYESTPPSSPQGSTRPSPGRGHGPPSYAAEPSPGPARPPARAPARGAARPDEGSRQKP
ncbi:cellulose binding domain-containing protein [Streptomyces hydrogenans]|uniref:cellulose binding domain-containing protein n=1 Tax=Streptomyces hydrogenans TaxID=1873719 RepID=UPI0035E0B497